MGNWTSVKEWLGLGDGYASDDDYDDYDDYEDYDVDDGTALDEPVYDRPAVRPVPASSTGRRRPAERDRGDEWDEGDGGVRVISASSEPEGPRGIVRPLPTAAQPVVISPTNFNDAPELADVFKANQPLILNLQGLDRDLFRRLVDFCSGFCYVLEGKMERVTDHVFLLTPQGAVVSDDDRQRIKDGQIIR